MNRRKKRFENPIKIEVTRRARMATILGKPPAISNGHQPPPVAQGELSKKLVFPHMFGYSHVLTTVVKIQHI